MAKAPFVAMQIGLRNEERVDLIAEITGFDRDAVLGKLFRLWAWCTARGLEDAPADCDGYAVHDRVIRQFLGERGIIAMLGDGCDALAMGVLRPDGTIYLRGTSETVSRLRGLRASASAGGLARVHGPAGAYMSRVNGRFVRNQQFHQLTDQLPPAGNQPETSARPADEPAPTSEILQITDHNIPSGYNIRKSPSGSPAAPALLPFGSAPLEPAAKPRGRRKREVNATDAERDAAARVLAKLGERNGVKYRGSDAHLRLIVGRLRDGFSELDLRKVIAYCAEPRSNGGKGWEDDENMRQYLAPETLFGPETFQKYIDPARSWAHRSYPEVGQ
jgi:uncharacterized phage protein (TIGR02220 family)